MARYNPTITVKEALSSYMNNPAFQEASGKLVINSSTSKRTGALFLFRGKVYSIQVKGYTGRLFTRLVNSGLLQEDSISELQRKYGRDQSNPAIIDYAAQKMMITAEQAGEFIREFSLGAWDDLYSWVGVKVEWKNGVTTENTTFSSRPVALERLIELGGKRAKYLEEIASNFTVNPEDLTGLKFQRIDDTYYPGGLEGDLMAYATGEYSINDLAEVTGVPVFNLISTVFSLWENDKVQVWYKEFKLIRKEIEQMHSDPNTYGAAQPVIRTDTRNIEVERAEEGAEPEGELQVSDNQIELSEDELEELRADPEIRALVEQAEAGEFHTESVGGMPPEEHIPPMPEADLEYVNEIDAELDDEDLPVEEEDMTDERVEEDELDFIPLEEDEAPASSVAAQAPKSIEEFLGKPLPEPKAEIEAEAQESDEGEEAEAAEEGDSGVDDPLIGSLVAQVRARREELRASATEAAERMAECDEAILSDGTQLSALDAQISALQAEFDATQTRIHENEKARGEWEAVYDDASAKYATFQQQLAALTD